MNIPEPPNSVSLAPLHHSSPSKHTGKPTGVGEASIYLMFAVLQVHGAGSVGDLIGLVLLMGLQGDELRPLPVLTLKDGVQVPGLVGTV